MINDLTPSFENREGASLKHSAKPQVITADRQVKVRSGSPSTRQASVIRSVKKIARQLRNAKSKHYTPRAYDQRCVVKIRYDSNMRDKPKAWALRGGYIGRRSATLEQEVRRGFDAVRHDIDIRSSVQSWQDSGDPRMFKLIFSPESHDVDLPTMVREVMAQMSTDMGRELEWIGARHINTKTPHVHVLLRGKDRSGNVFRLNPGYVKYGIRRHAIEACNRQLGYKIVPAKRLEPTLAKTLEQALYAAREIGA